MSPTHDWAKLITGTWVSSQNWPEGGHAGNCATDTDFQFSADGSYDIDSGVVSQFEFNRAKGYRKP